MTGGAPSCGAHRALVDAALAADPSDETLEAYADTVPTCAACQRALAVWLAEREGDGLVRLHRPSRVAVGSPSGPRSWRAVAAASIAVAGLAAGLAFALRSVDPPRAGVVEADTPAASAVAAPRAVAAPDRVPSPGPPGDPWTAPRPDPAPAPPRPDASWPAPPFEDLRLAQAKGAEPAMSDVQLVLVGPEPPRSEGRSGPEPSRSEGRSGPVAPAVGDRVAIEVASSRATTLAVCVEGPERGVVWRGAVPAGRTPLSRAGRGQSFAFAAPGRYRFVLGIDPDAEACEPAVHRVDVDVRSGP